MTQKLKQQINRYAGFAGALLAVDKVNGQVVYVDVNPDTLIIANTCDSIYKFFIDIDNDLIDDFKFKVEIDCTNEWGSAFVKIDPLLQNKVNNGYYHDGWWSDTDTALNVMRLNPGDTINGNGFWAASEKFLWSNGWGSIGSDYWFQGGWHPVTDKCLPFLLRKNSQNYYGWMRIEVLTNHSFILKEFAFQLQPNVSILACDATNLATEISEHNQQQFIFYQQNNSIHISTFQKLNHTNISVYDLLGKEILEKSFSGKEIHFAIDKKGIYFVEINSEKGVFRKKIFIY